MCKQLIFATLALFLLGWPEGNRMKALPFLPTMEFASLQDSIPPLQVLSLRNKRNALHQMIIPRRQPKMTNLDGQIIDPQASNQIYLNIFEMIRGRVPGVWVTGTFYHYRIRIRGSGGPPLVVVDGMTFYGYNDQEINFLLEAIPPIDVDYIEVLKGMAQAAIYGPGAGNGVIVIHTKAGGSNDPRSGQM